MRILVLTTDKFAPTHTPKLLKQINYLNNFSDVEVVVKKDMPLADIEHLIMTNSFDCVYPTTVFKYSNNGKNIVSFNKILYQILEYHKQPYIGSELFTHMLLNDKALTNLKSNISLPNILLTRILWEKKYSVALQYIITAPFPVIVKPNTLAASLGITKKSIAYSIDEAINIIDIQFKQFPNVNELLLEHYLDNAYEFTVSVTGNNEKSICSTTALVSRTQNYEIFSYSNKNLDSNKRTLKYSSEIPNDIKKYLKDKAIYLSKLFKVRDYSRFDFLMNSNRQIYLIDANSLPALGSNYLLEYVNKQLIDETQLLSLLILVFCKRIGMPIPKCKAELSDEILRNIL